MAEEDRERPRPPLRHLDRAKIPKAKILGYLLSEAHPTGQAKASFFRSMGFRAERWEVLRDALAAHAENASTTIRQASEFGSKYVVDGTLEGPGGRRARVRAVWFVEAGTAVARFVTAYPAPRRKG